EAFVDAGADITVTGGPLTFAANSSSDADASSLDISIGLIDVRVLKANAKVQGSTRAYVGDNASVDAGATSLLATSTANTANADQTAVSLGPVSATVLSPHATT